MPEYKSAETEMQNFALDLEKHLKLYNQKYKQNLKNIKQMLIAIAILLGKIKKKKFKICNKEYKHLNKMLKLS